MCRVAGKALYEFGLENSVPVRILSMHDHKDAAIANPYFPAEIFTSFAAAKVSFIQTAVSQGSKSRVVILSHINLLLAGWLIKKIAPATKVILITHGIEVWKPLDKMHLMMLAACDRVLAVSSYTKNKLIAMHHLPVATCAVLNNCIDPFLKRPAQKMRSQVLVNRYGIQSTDTVILTLTRLSLKDRYKGYGNIIQSLGEIIKTNKNLKYILAGGCEASEKEYILSLIEKYGLQAHVILTGFVAEAELPDHFSLADIYVMPSMKEGFGIVFIEAMYYGVPVIAGNADGSVDALLQGELGLLIEPENVPALTAALSKMIENNSVYLPNHHVLMEHFGYQAYKRKLAAFIKVQ